MIRTHLLRPLARRGRSRNCVVRARAKRAVPKRAARGQSERHDDPRSIGFDAVVKARIAQGQPDSPELRNAIKDALINQEILAQEA